MGLAAILAKRPRRRRQNSRREPFRRALGFEPMEDRCLLSVLGPSPGPSSLAGESSIGLDTPAQLGLLGAGDDKGAPIDIDGLVDLIQTTIAPETWDSLGGPGPIEEFAGGLSLVVAQTQQVHNEIADLLGQLRRLQDLQVTIEVRFITVSDTFFDDIGVDFDFDILGGARGVPTVPDINFRQGAYQIGVPDFPTPTPETFQAAEAILSDLDTFLFIEAVHENDQVQILTAPKVTLFNNGSPNIGRGQLRRFVREVTPIVEQHTAALQPAIGALPAGMMMDVSTFVSVDGQYERLTVAPEFSNMPNEFAFQAMTPVDPQGPPADFDDLIDLIQTTIAPETWDSLGGPGTIEEFGGTMNLVIEQTQQVHNDIADLLAQLRRLQGLQVTIETRFITVEDDFFERIGVDFDFDLDGGEGLPSQADIRFGEGSARTGVPDFGTPTPDGVVAGLAILSDIETFFFIEAAKENGHVEVITAPKVTLFDDGLPDNPGRQVRRQTRRQLRRFVRQLDPLIQQYTVGFQPLLGALPAGMMFDASAVVSADRQYVRITTVPVFSRVPDVLGFQFMPPNVPDDGVEERISITVSLVAVDSVALAQLPPGLSGSPEINDVAQQVIQRQADIQEVVDTAEITEFIAALDDLGVAQILGQVELVTLDGQPAHFLSGGQFPTGVGMTTTFGGFGRPFFTVVPEKFDGQTQTEDGIQLDFFPRLGTLGFDPIITTVSVPDGGTVLLGGVKRLQEGRTNTEQPILNRIPYVNRLFKNVGLDRSTTSLLMMVTPRIIIQEEE